MGGNEGRMALMRGSSRSAKTTLLASSIATRAWCTGSLGHPFLQQVHLGVNEGQGRGYFCQQGCVASLFQWQPELSSGRDFQSSMFPHECVQHDSRH
jgi:hypothetical protein